MQFMQRVSVNCETLVGVSKNILDLRSKLYYKVYQYFCFSNVYFISKLFHNNYECAFIIHYCFIIYLSIYKNEMVFVLTIA